MKFFTKLRKAIFSGFSIFFGISIITLIGFTMLGIGFIGTIPLILWIVYMEELIVMWAFVLIATIFGGFAGSWLLVSVTIMIAVLDEVL